MHPLLRGAIAGTLATIPMTLVMTSLFRRLPAQQRYPLPPALITAELAMRAGVRDIARGPALTGSTLAAHFGYGAATGALFPLLDRGAPAPALLGPAYGLAIWAISYLGWIPALRILAPATRHPRRRNVLMLTAHVVWGAALAVTSRQLSRPRATRLVSDMQ